MVLLLFWAFVSKTSNVPGITNLELVEKLSLSTNIGVWEGFLRHWACYLGSSDRFCVLRPLKQDQLYQCATPVPWLCQSAVFSLPPRFHVQASADIIRVFSLLSKFTKVHFLFTRFILFIGANDSQNTIFTAFRSVISSRKCCYRNFAASPRRYSYSSPPEDRASSVLFVLSFDYGTLLSAFTVSCWKINYITHEGINKIFSSFYFLETLTIEESFGQFFKNLWKIYMLNTG